jgi:hypothetical protein
MAEWLYNPRERDRTVIDAWQACSAAEETRITAAECAARARALREEAAALRREAKLYRDISFN